MTDAPVFGDEEPDRLAFKLRIHKAAGGSFVEEFTAYGDVDAGAMVELMGARTEAQQMRAIPRLFRTALVDDDGTPGTPTEGEEGERVEGRVGSSRERFLAYLDDEDVRVPLAALMKLVEWLGVEESDRPTIQPGPSSPGQPTTGT